MSDEAWKKQAERVAELARDRTARAYLLGRLCADCSAGELADLVEAALVYRERFGAPGNDRNSSPGEVLMDRHHFTSGSVAGIRYTGYRGQELPDL